MYFDVVFQILIFPQIQKVRKTFALKTVNKRVGQNFHTTFFCL